MALNALDFSTYYIPSVSQSDVVALRQAGWDTVVMGFDPSSASAAVRAAFVAANFRFRVYRFMYWNEDPSTQVHSIATAIHVNPLPLPDYCFFDVEENYNGPDAASDPVGYLRAIKAAAYSEGITPTEQVKPGIYTRKGYWNQWFPQGWTELADEGWVLWTADSSADPDTASTYGGWSNDKIQGVQYAWDKPTGIGKVDYSRFRDPSVVITPPGGGGGNPPVVTPPDLTALTSRVTAVEGRLDHIESELSDIKKAIV